MLRVQLFYNKYLTPYAYASVTINMLINFVSLVQFTIMILEQLFIRQLCTNKSQIQICSTHEMNNIRAIKYTSSFLVKQKINIFHIMTL